MKLASALAIAALSPVLFAQMGPPPRVQGSPSMRGGSGMGRPAAATARPSTAVGETETIHLLRMAAVQADLALTPTEVERLGPVARALQSAAVTEEAALSAVSKILALEQTHRLEQLLVQDLGYNSLALADVRAALSLTDEQTTQITSILAMLESAKGAFPSTTDWGATTWAKSALKSKTSVELAKVLTADQDKKLRSLAGAALRIN